MNGKEYFWMCERALKEYRWLSVDEKDEVLAEAVYQCYSLPYELTYALARWAVRYAIGRHCVMNPRYPHIPIHLIRDKTWQVYQPEIQESNVVDLSKYRQRKVVN